MTTEIPIGGGTVVLVDDGDAAAVTAAGRWHVRRHGRTSYAQRHLPLSDGRRTTQQLHTFLTGLLGVDHANGNGLDNRRANLRLADQSQNTANTRIRTDNTSGFKGVTRRRSRWIAQIRVHGVQQHLGTFDTAEEAARAYDAAALDQFGPFARINLPKETPHVPAP